MGFLLKLRVPGPRPFLGFCRSFGGVFVDRLTSVYLLNEHRVDLEAQFFQNVRLPLHRNRKPQTPHVAQVLPDDAFDKLFTVRVRILNVEEMLLENGV